MLQLLIERWADGAGIQILSSVTFSIGRCDFSNFSVFFNVNLDTVSTYLFIYLFYTSDMILRVLSHRYVQWQYKNILWPLKGAAHSCNSSWNLIGILSII
jgi:hypothetical protein